MRSSIPSLSSKAEIKVKILFRISLDAHQIKWRHRGYHIWLLSLVEGFAKNVSVFLSQIHAHSKKRIREHFWYFIKLKWDDDDYDEFLANRLAMSNNREIDTLNEIKCKRYWRIEWNQLPIKLELNFMWVMDYHW